MKLIAHTEAMSSFVLSKIKSYNLLRQKSESGSRWQNLLLNSLCLSYQDLTKKVDMKVKVKKENWKSHSEDSSRWQNLLPASAYQCW